MSSNLLTILIVLPLIGALPLLIVRDRNAAEIKVWAFFSSLFTFLVSLKLWDFHPHQSGYQFVEDVPWISFKGALNIHYALGVDGISLLLILLTTFITPIAILGVWNYIKDRQK